MIFEEVFKSNDILILQRSMDLYLAHQLFIIKKIVNALKKQFPKSIKGKHYGVQLNLCKN